MKYQNTFQWNESISGEFYSCWKYTNKPDSSYPMHCHSYYEISYVTAGDRKQFFNGDYYEAKEDSLFFFAPLSVHSYYNETEVSDVILQFSPEFLRTNASQITQNAILTLADPDCPYLAIEELPSIKEKLLELKELSNSVDTIAQREETPISQRISLALKSSALLSQLIADLLEVGFLCIQEQSRSYSDFVMLDDVINYLLTHPKEMLSMTEAAAMANVSYYHFSRLFKKATGLNYNTYLHELKLQYIEEQLIHTTTSIADIALESGMETNSGLTRFFKKYRGISPTEYRKKYQSSPN